MCLCKIYFGSTHTDIQKISESLRPPWRDKTLDRSAIQKYRYFQIRAINLNGTSHKVSQILTHFKGQDFRAKVNNKSINTISTVQKTNKYSAVKKIKAVTLHH